ncbi:MAG: HEAT repeat domain-containing protein [Nitrosopumilus sp.]|nr:MAG: HEAT repeat domain-containing protein [Nitrosopumilus sp.]
MENVLKNLEFGNSNEKIKTLESLDSTDNPEVLRKIVSKLDDTDIKVRGEAFSSLVLNKNKIVDFLIDDLNSESENMKCSILLILGNRNEISSIPDIIKLVKDKKPAVRSCAIGTLGHLQAQKNSSVFREALSDSNIEVRKSALQAIIDLKITVSKNEIKNILKENDSEIEKMISLIEK